MSVGVVNKTTGDRIQTAGDPLDKVGNLANLTTTAKGSAVEAINEVNAGLATKADLTDLAPAFSSETAYAVGQYVSYDGNIYKCTSAHSAGAWVAGDFTLVAVGSELSEINSNISTLESGLMGVFSTTGLNTTGCQIMDGGYAKIGNLVFVQVLIKATSSTSFTISNFPKGVGTLQESQYPPRIAADDSEFLFCQFLSDGMQIFTFGQAPVIDKLYKLSCLYLAQ